MKNIQIASLSLLSVLLLTSCGGKVVSQKGQQVTVRVEQTTTDGPKLVRLEVMGEKIIRVTATAENKFADRPSLIIVPQDQQVKYETTERGDTVQVKTAFVVANVLKSNGQVWFTNLIVQRRLSGQPMPTALPKCLIQLLGRDGLHALSSKALPMRHSMASASIRPTTGTIRVRTKSFSSTTPRCPFHSSFRAATMACLSIAIR